MNARPLLKSVYRRRTAAAVFYFGLAAAAVAAVPHAARAQDTIYGFTTGNSLFRFSSTTPNNVTNIGTISNVTGTLLDIDFRPSNGLLYGLSRFNNSQNTSSFGLNLYTINTSTAVATLVTPLSLTGATFVATTYDIDFNPVVDALRIVSSNDENLRLPTAQIAPGFGNLIADTSLTLSGAPVGNISGVAYANNVAGASATTLYDIRSAAMAPGGQLYLQGSVNGTPASPNTGVLTTVGSGTGVLAPEFAFDISGVTGTAYLAANNTLYTANLTNGTVGAGLGINTVGLSGSVQGISAFTPVVATAAPEPGTFVLLGMGLAGGVGGLAVRRRKA